MKPSILWVIDPWISLDHPNDTTLRLIEESLILKIPTYLAELPNIELQKGSIRVLAKPVLAVKSRTATDVQFGAERSLAPSRFAVIHYRTDPPVDGHYIHPLQLLVAGVRGTKTKILNPPSELVLQSEKFELEIPSYARPKTLIASEWNSILEFGQSLGKTVIKPLHQAQSKGVELIDWAAPETRTESRALVQKLTTDFTVPILVQEYLRQIHDGEKRLWFAGGKLLAAILKRPLTGDFRVQIDRGSVIEPATLTAKERSLAQSLSRTLKRRGIALAAVDLIAGRVCDFNITSPGLLVQMEKVTSRNLSRDLLRQIHGKLAKGC